MRELLMDGLSADGRRDLHGRIARSLENAYADDLEPWTWPGDGGEPYYYHSALVVALD